VALIVPRPDHLKRTADARVRDRHLILPVTLFYQGQYYDAALYKSLPTPMALYPETVYEVQRSGEAVGTITVEDGGRFDRGWQGEGRLRLNSGGDQQAATRASQPEQPAQNSQAASKPQSPAEDRPVLHRHSDTPAPAPPPPAPKPTPAASSAPLPAAAAPPASSAPTMANQILIGVSDATSSETHSFALSWNATELDRLGREASRLASVDAANSVAEHCPTAMPRASSSAPAARTRSRGPASPVAAPAVALQNVQVRYFDLDSDNNPEVVLTAELPLPAGAAPDGGNIHVAFVARQEGGTDWHTLFSSITDDTRLDIEPRLEFVDAVDADGDGIAELLFRTYTSQLPGGTPGYRLYHPYGDRLRLAYDSRGER
jgi:hypothetical protein